jgi:hypothetical protein
MHCERKKEEGRDKEKKECGSVSLLFASTRQVKLMDGVEI